MNDRVKKNQAKILTNIILFLVQILVKGTMIKIGVYIEDLHDFLKWLQCDVL